MSDKAAEKLAEGCTLLFLSLFVGVVSYFVLAFVVGQMWDWYVTPVFDIARPDYALLVGLCVLVGYITNHTSMAETIGIKKEKVGSWLTFGAMFYDSLVAPFMILLVGWIVHFFI
jgi:hypothetical protein